MKASVKCHACGAIWDTGSLTKLAELTCSSCQKSAEPRASEDFASAVEDALAQLWHLSQSFELTVTLTTTAIPAAFVPPDDL